MIDRVQIRHGRKTQNCRWNFHAIYDSSRDVSNSGFWTAIIAISVVGRYRNYLETLFELDTVENP